MPPRLRLALKIAGWIAGAVAVLLIVAGVAGTVLYSRYEKRAAQFDLTKIDDVAERSTVYDANGELYSYFGGENRLTVPLSGVSQNFIKALLSREDSRFWKHHGVDYRGIARAVLINFRAGETKQGASTITQQLARNACGLGARSMDRKALEAVLARRIETQYSKDKILELYINRIYFGAGYYGIETAARGYFGKAAAELTLGESAALAALIRSPQRLAPSRDLAASLEGRDAVLTRMSALGMITAEELAAAKAQQLKVVSSNTMRVANDSIMDAVQRELATFLAPETLEFGGLKVSMTIDPALQRLAEAAANQRLTEIEEQRDYPHPRKKDFVPNQEGDPEKPTDYLQAAVVLIDNRTGAIRAAVGGRDFTHSKYQRALVAKRQIGSTFKPFVYAAAFERGLLPGTYVTDAKITPGEFADLPKKWSPENSDGEYGGMQPAAVGLLKSRNTMSVRVGEYATLSKVRETASEAGLGQDIPKLPVIFLGGFEATVRDVTTSYAIFANQGVYRASYLISKVEDKDGRVLWEMKPTEKKVLSPESAWMTSGILQQIMKTGTASKAGSLGWKKEGAGKTGTTNDFFDAWFVGYTSSMTCGVWVGMDHPQTIMPKGYGSALALPIWVDVMRQVPEKDYPALPLTTAALPSKKVTLCSVTGELATSTCAAQHLAYDVELPASRLPRERCHTHPETPAPVIATMPAPVAPESISPASRTAPSAGQAPVPVASAPSVPSSTPLSPPATVANRSLPVTSMEATQPAEGAGPVPFHERTEAALPSSARPPTTIQMAPQESARPLPSTARARKPAPMPEEPVIGKPESVTPDQSSASHEVARTPLPRGMEVRRAVPVERTSGEAESGATAKTPPTLPPGVSEQRIVEKMPDGRTRTTVIRTIRGSSKDRKSSPPPPSKRDDD